MSHTEERWKAGFYWHAHGELVDYLDGWYIYKNNPELNRVKGELPQDLVDAGRNYAEAPGGTTQEEAGRGLESRLLRHRDYLLKLHEEECPNCSYGE